MASFLKNVRVILFNGLFIIYILSLIFPSYNLELVISIGSLFALLFAFPGIPHFYQLMVIITLSFSILLMSMNNLFSYDSIYYFAGMTNILVLVTYASVFAIPVKLGAYPRKIYVLFRSKVNSMKSIYITFSLSTFALCSFMSAGAFPTLKTSLSRLLRHLPEYAQKEIQIRTLIRPFVLTLFCMPIAASPAIAISETGSNPLIVLSIMGFLAGLFLFLDIMFTYKKLQKIIPVTSKHNENGEMGSKASTKTKVSLLLFLISIILMVTIVLFIHFWVGYSILDSVLLTIFPFSFTWAFMLKKSNKYVKLLRTKMKEDVPNLAPQIALFLAIGFMINAIQNSRISDDINTSIIYLMDYLGPFILLVISLFVFLISCTGIFPQLVTVLVAQTINLEQIGLTPEWFAMAVLAGVLSGSAASPFTVNAHIASVTIGEKPLNIVKKNLIFAICILIVVTTVAIIMEH